MNDLISIIVPVYKVEQYLPKCIDSILDQTYRNLEIILVDDGSPDMCGRICDEYAKQDTRIRVIHKENQGLGYARNSGLEICSGTYIMFVDSDDFLSTDAVQVLYERIVSDQSDMAMGKHIDTYADGRLDDTSCKWMQDLVISGENLCRRMDGSINVPVSAWGKLYRRSIFENLSYPSLKCGEDLWIFPEIMDQCERISVINGTIYYYFQRNTSIVHMKSETAKRDELDATLRMTVYFVNNNMMNCAYAWYSRGIDKAGYFKNKRAAIILFRQYFNRSIRTRMMHNLPRRELIKWWALFIPFGHEAYRHIRSIVKASSHVIVRT